MNSYIITTPEYTLTVTSGPPPKPVELIKPTNVVPSHLHYSTPKPIAKPESEWPLKIKMIAKLAKEGDKGVGDTLARLLQIVKADKMAELFPDTADVMGKAMMKILGMGSMEAVAFDLQLGGCGCGGRQNQLNKNFPYTK